jgi:hypothetical protein
MSKEQLQQRVLVDPHVQIYACERRDIQAGLIDRRVLAAVEFLSGSGLDPSVSSLACGTNLNSAGTTAAGATGSSIDITRINGIPILGHQGPGTITDITIRRLLTLQAALKPNQIISTMAYKGQTNTLALPDHNNRVQIAYTPLLGQNKKLAAQVAMILQPGQWAKLIDRLNQIPNPAVPLTPSKYAVRAGGYYAIARLSSVRAATLTALTELLVPKDWPSLASDSTSPRRRTLKTMPPETMWPSSDATR